MYGFIDKIDWLNAEAMKYWSYPSNTKADPTTEIKNLIFSGDYWGSLKIDGFYERILKDEDGNCFMISRAKNVKGEATDKIEWVPQLQDFLKGIPNGSCFLCECFLPNNEGSKKITSLLGCLKEKCIARQEAGQKLHFFIFDVMAWNGENYIEKAARERFRMVEELATDYPHEYVRYARYYNGKELWSKLQEWLASGREGIVITHKDCPVYFKRTPARKTVKVKRELRDDIDCFFTGKFFPPARLYTGKEIDTWKYWQNAVTGEKLQEGMHYKKYFDGAPIEPVTKSFFFNFAGSLEIGVYKENIITSIGKLSGLSEEIRSNPAAFSLQPIKVTAMEIDSDSGALRHGKLIEFRKDINIEDCTWDKVFDR